MFSGIIHQLGLLQLLITEHGSKQLWIKHHFKNLQLGESIAVNGVCLTVAEIKPDLFRCDLSQETLDVTSFRDCIQDEVLNLERALCVGDRLGGHFVQGHVDQTLTLSAIEKIGDNIRMQFTGIDKTAQPFVIKKGSITVNGVSLTINAVDAGGVSVMLVPHTIQHTNLRFCKVGAQVNVEFDMMPKMIKAQIDQYKELEHGQNA